MPIILLLAVLSAADVDQVRDGYRNAIEAYQQGNSEAMKAAAARLVAQRPGSPTFIYLAAAAEAMSGNTAAALPGLRRLADMGLAMRADQEPAFAGLKSDERFREIVLRYRDNARARGEARVVLELDDGHFIPESVVYDAATGRHLIGSVRQRRIVAVSADAAVEELVGPGEHGLMSAMGMKLDADARRLYVATTGAREAPETPEHLLGRAGVLVFDADSGDLVSSHLLPETDQEQWLGDLLIHEGRVWATDSKSGALWCLDPTDGSWHQPVGPGQLSSPQGLTPGTASDEIYVADYSGGLWRVSTDDGSLSPLSVPSDVNAYGIDGLYRHGHSLIAIQNGHQPHRIVRLRLSDDGRSVTGQEVLLAALPEFDDPTLGTIIDGDLHFVANSHWPRFDADKNLPPAAELTGPIVMKVSLD